MPCTPTATGYSLFARGVCVAAPRRGALSFWIHAHSPRGHGIHSPLLYTMCREVFFTLFRQKKEFTSYTERTSALVALLQEWWTKNPTRALQHQRQEVLLIDDTSLLENMGQQLISQDVIAFPPVILVCTPRHDAKRWQAWCATYRAMSEGVVIDLYGWGLLLFVKDIALHKFAVRGFIR